MEEQDNVSVTEAAEQQTNASAEPAAKEKADSGINIDTLMAQKRHWREKALRGEEELQTLRERLAASETRPSAKPQSTDSSDELDAALHLQAQGYLPEEIVEVRRFAKRTNQSLSEATNDPIIKNHIEMQRSKAKVEQATPASSGKVVVQAAPAAPSWQDLPKGRQREAALRQTWTSALDGAKAKRG